MDPEDCKWLGIATPFRGIRFLLRSGQGLLGQSEEFEELLTKILKEELQQGKCCKITDDIFVGGQTHEEAADTYMTILAKLHQANIKISAKKNSHLSQNSGHPGLDLETRRTSLALSPQTTSPQKYRTRRRHYHQRSV